MRASVLVCVVALALSIAVAVEGRKTISGRKLASDRIGAYDGDDFHFSDYLRYLLEILILVVVIGVLHILFIPAYLIWRCFRLCFCKPQKDGFGKGCVRTVRLAIFIAALGILGACIAGLSTIAVMFSGLMGLTKNLLSNGRTLVNDVRVTAQRLQAQPRTATSNVQDAVDAGDNILDNVQTVDDDNKKYSGYYKTALYVLMAIPLAVIGGAALLTLCGVTCCGILRIVGLISYFFCGLVVVVAAVQVTLWIVTTDGCKEINPSTSTKTLRDAIGCAGNATDTSSTFGSLRNIATDAIRDATTQACVGARALCDSPDGRCTLTTCDSTNYGQYPNQTVFDAVLGVITFTRCKADCTDSTNKANAATLVDGVAEIDAYNDILAVNIEPLLECRFLNAMTHDIHADLCVKFARGLFGSTIVLFIEVLVADITAVLLFYGSQRIGKTAQVANADDEVYEYEYDSQSDDKSDRDRNKSDS